MIRVVTPSFSTRCSLTQPYINDKSARSLRKLLRASHGTMASTSQLGGARVWTHAGGHSIAGITYSVRIFVVVSAVA